MRGKTGADREISVNTYTGGFTTMLNHHLRNRNLSLKAVGLLSKMLSLPPDWDYSIRGLAMLNTDGIDGIRTAMKELEDEGYVVRVQSRDERGRMSRNKYTVYALPQKEKPSPDLPSSENPTTVKPPPDEPMTEKPTQINTNQVIPKKRNDSLSKYQSINPDGMDAMDERERYEEIIRENLEVDILSQDSRYDIDRVNEIIEVIFGIRQSGLLEFKMADVFQDSHVLREAYEAAKEVSDGELLQIYKKYERLREKLCRYTDELSL